MSKFNFLKNKNTIFVGIAIVAIIVTGVLIFVDSNHGFALPNFFGMSGDQIGKKVVDYINSNQLSQTQASLVSVSEEGGLFKVKIKIGENDFDSYATKDGRFLFPTGIDMNPKKDTAGPANKTSAEDQAKAVASVTKTDNPMLEAFVVARCPFGLQMQRAMADAVKNMPSLAQYVKVRYMGAVSGNTITAMHGAAEATENLRQICIREEQPAKYWDYVACQMKASGTETSCEKSTGVDSAKLSSCISTPSKGVAYAQKDFTLSDAYNVSGSPTLILNGKVISENSFGGRSSDGVKSMACAGFNSRPSFCSTALNTAVAASSFSSTYASSSGSAGSDTNCAPAQ